MITAMMLPPSNLAIASLGVMSAAFLAIAFAEQAAPVAATSGTRLRANFGLGVTNGLLMLALPTGTAAASLFAAQHGWGLLQSIDAPWLLGVLILLMARSLSTYGLHRLLHAVPWLWRFHRVHHSDLHCDLSTSFRSHPLEALMALPLAMLITTVVGPRIEQLVAVETLLVTIAMWEHGQTGPVRRMERWLGLVVATPHQHRLHHSADPLHRDRNFGDGLILWDRLFGTYVAGAKLESFGVSDCPTGHGLRALLTQPFRR